MSAVGPWVQTESGVPFDLLAPRGDDVRIDDIAGQLSKINRFAGATMGATGYSVAQHSVHVSMILQTWGAPLEVVREGLLHDAAEAYYGDVSSPVQRAMTELHRTALAKVVNEEAALWAEKSPHVFGSVSTDIATMVSRLKDDPFRALKQRIDPVVRAALGLPAVEHALVKRADLVALACERSALMAPCERDWQLPEYADERWAVIVALSPKLAHASFLDRFGELRRALAQKAQPESEVPGG